MLSSTRAHFIECVYRVNPHGFMCPSRAMCLRAISQERAFVVRERRGNAGRDTEEDVGRMGGRRYSGLPSGDGKDLNILVRYINMRGIPS